jgi:nucleotide-binding universal stress UspA family protein
MAYQKILLTHDSSELADAAVAHTAELARATGAAVLVLHAVDSVADAMIQMTAGSTWGASEATVQVAEQAVAAQRDEAERTLQRVEAELRAEGVAEVSSLVVEGDAGTAIVDTAKRENCDVIVMATHGRSGIVRTILGSVADYVVRNAGCAVLLCRPAPAKE